MTRAAATRHRRALAEQPPPTAAELHGAVHWRLDGTALRRAGYWEHGGADVTLTLGIEVRDGIARAEATLSAGDRALGLRLPGELASALCVVSEAAGLVHVDAAPVLTATLERGDRRRVLYARSGLLEFLGLAGGRYEVAGGTVRGSLEL